MRGALAIMVLSLAACSAEPAARSPAAIAADAAAAAPSDARLARLYDGSCRACHALPESGAPLTHDRRTWDQRWAQGEATLLEHTISGYNGMPAGGQCFACTAEDHRALIAFMAGRGE